MPNNRLEELFSLPRRSEYDVSPGRWFVDESTGEIVVEGGGTPVSVSVRPPARNLIDSAGLDYSVFIQSAPAEEDTGEARFTWDDRRRIERSLGYYQRSRGELVADFPPPTPYDQLQFGPWKVKYVEPAETLRGLQKEAAASGKLAGVPGVPHDVQALADCLERKEKRRAVIRAKGNGGRNGVRKYTRHKDC